MKLQTGLPLVFAAAAAAVLQPVCTRAEAPVDGRIVLPDTVVPEHYDLAVTPDAKNLTFKGVVSIQIAVRAPTDRIVLNAADLVIDRARLAGTAAAPAISYDDKVQTATFAFPSHLPPGEYVLGLDYHGKIYQQASGLFALDYDTPRGKARALFTQFEAADARRFLPCWDEPGRKATFSLTATVPADLLAISNMPIAAREALAGGLQRVHFAQTPKMSSYLLFFGAGDLERVHRDVGGVDVGVVVKRGDTASAQFALSAAAQILPYYNNYFGTPYPLPKLDLIAGPGTSQFFSAMENWGAIFYFERSLLFDPKISTESNKVNIHITIAHEMSHQWFGDLVTMQWWDNLWLNEGFASWMQQKATDHFHPEWKVWLAASAGKQSVMQTDARDGTHPVITPITDVLQASSAFDNITYTKGQAVIRMLEAYVGEDNFRAGVRRYMKDYAYGNTVTDDLWREIDAASTRKLSGIARDFTLAAGLPMITAAPSGTGLRLSVDRFALDHSGDAGGTWRVPVIVLPASGSTPAGVQRTTVTAGQPVSLPDLRPGAVVNAGQTGYFRVLYQDRAFTALIDRFDSLSADDQIGVLNDVATFGKAGRAPMGDFLALASRISPAADSNVWVNLASELAWLDSLYEGLPTRPAFRIFARRVLAPEYQRVGFDAKPGEPDTTAILRSTLLVALGKLADPAVVGEARRRFAIYLTDHTTLVGSGRNSVLTIAAINADPAAWEQFHGLARATKSSFEKQDFYRWLALARDSALANQALALALTDEAEVTLRPGIVSAVSYLHPELAFDFAVRHWDVLSPMIEPGTRSEYITYLLYSASETAVLDRLSAFAAQHIPPTENRYLRKIGAEITDLARIRAERLPEIDRWLATEGTAATP